MTSLMSNLLFADNVAQRYGCKLKPQLRNAIEADLRFPSHAASPQPTEDQTAGELPENVVRLDTAETRKKARA